MCQYNATAIHRNRARFADIAPLRWSRYSATADTKLRDNYNLLQKQSQVGFSPEKYADSAEFKGRSLDKSNNQVLVSVKQIDNDFYVVIEQLRKKQNELSYKNMYFGKGKFDKKILGDITKLPASS